MALQLVDWVHSVFVVFVFVGISAVAAAFVAARVDGGAIVDSVPRIDVDDD